MYWAGSSRPNHTKAGGGEEELWLGWGRDRRKNKGKKLKLTFSDFDVFSTPGQGTVDLPDELHVV